MNYSLEMLTSHLLLASEILIGHDDERREYAEEQAKSKDDGPTNSLAQWGVISKERALTGVLTHCLWHSVSVEGHHGVEELVLCLLR